MASRTEKKEQSCVTGSREPVTGVGSYSYMDSACLGLHSAGLHAPLVSTVLVLARPVYTKDGGALLFVVV